MRSVKLFCWIAACVFSVSGAQAVQVVRNTAGGNVTWSHYDSYIGDVTLVRGTASHSDGYDNAMQVQVTGSVQTSTELHFSSAYAMAVEYVAVANASASAQTYSITCSGNLGSDSSTTWHYSSASGPYYTISSDQSSPSTDGGDPVVSFIYGDYSVNRVGTLRSMPFSSGSDTHSFSVSNVTIPAGRTHGYLFFSGVGDIDDTSYNRPAQARLAVLQLVDSNQWPEDFTDFLTADQRDEIVNWDLAADELKITPSEETVFRGYAGGPFLPTNQIYTLRNRTDAAMNWTVSSSEDWLTVTPTNGTIGANGTQEVTVAVNEQAADFPIGGFPASLTFTTAELQTEYVRELMLTVHPSPALPVAPINPFPADGAVEASAGTLLEWEHDSGAVPPSPLVNTTSTYTVYFGTNANELAVAASGLTNAFYDPGILDVDTPYYWQVAASNAVGVTTGAVWNFTTWISGPLDHFEVAIVSDHPRMTRPIDVAMYARDAQGHLVVDYSGSATISAYRNTTNTTSLLKESFEGSDVDDWNLASGVYPTNHSSYAGNECLFFSTNSGSASFTHDALQPNRVEFAVRSENAVSYSYLSFSDSSYNMLAYFQMSGNNLFVYTGSGFLQPFPFEAGRWYQIALHLDWEQELIDWYIDGQLVRSGQPFMRAGLSSLGRISISSASGNQVCFDEIEYLNQEIEPQFVSILNAGATFASGSWTGSVSLAEYIGSAYLLATTGGSSGISDNFEIDYLGDLSTQFPEVVTEGDGVRSGAAQVSVSVPQDTNIVVALSASPGAEIEVPGTVEIPAGQTNAFFDFTVLDDGLLDGTWTSLVTVALTDYRGSSTSVPVHDNETAGLALSLPEIVYEAAGFVSGIVEVDLAPDTAVYVELLSDNPGRIKSGYALIPAGQTYATFNLRIPDNFVNDGVQTATVTAQVRNWTDSRGTLFIYDNEVSRMTLSILPNTVEEGSGVITNQAYLSLSGSVTHEVKIRLQSSDPAELSVPEWITIPAGGSAVYFDFEVYDDEETDGAQVISVLAESPGFVSGADTVRVMDNELHHLEVDGLADDVPLLEPATITVSARTIDGYPVGGFAGPVTLSASGDRGAIAVTPSVVSNFTDGAGSEAVAFGRLGNGVTLFMDGGAGLDGTSAVFNVVGPQMVVDAEPLTNIPVVAGGASFASLSISNAGNADLEYVLRDVSLQAYYPFDGDAHDGSGNGNNGVVFGATLFKNRFGEPGSAYLFDGATSYLDAGMMGGFKTVSMWVRQGARDGNDYYFGHEDFRLFASSASGRLTLGDGVSEIATSIQMDSHVAEWAHLVAISAGADSKVYFNGVLVGTGTLGAVSNHVVNLGRHSDGSHYLGGYLDDVRVYDRPLSEEEIGLLYQESHLDSGLVASYPFNGNATDVSGNGNNATVSSATQTTDRFGNAGSAYQLNGSYGHIQLPTGILSGLSECTISGWVDLYRLDQWSRIFDFGVGASVNMFLTPYSGNGTMRLAITTGGNGGEQRIDAATLALNRWHHIVITMGGGVGTMYVNGAVAGRNTAMSLTPADLGTTTQNWIGRSQYSPDPYLFGKVDDFRIYRRQLSSVEINTLYTEGNESVGAPDASWLAAAPTSGTVAPGDRETVQVAFSAAGRIAGDSAESALRIASNDPMTPKVELPASMWVVPPAPLMEAEPESTPGFSNTVSWSAVDGPVEYEVVVAAGTNDAILAGSSWIAATNHSFGGLVADSVYYYRARASVAGSIGRLPGPWSDWVWSMQMGNPADLDADALPDWWENQYLGGMAAGDALSDSDGDGQSNLAEYIAGTNPTNGVERFLVSAEEPSTNKVFIITWDSVTGRVYTVYWSPSLMSPFQPLETGLVYPRNSYTDQVHQAESQGYYSVDVNLEQE